MDNINDIFSDCNTEIKPSQMTAEEFISKTRTILKKIDIEYAMAMYMKILDDDDLKNQDCDNCKGECNIVIDGEKCRVFCNSDGTCVMPDLDHEQFYNAIKNMMFNNGIFYDLLSCEIIEKEGE